MAGGAAGVCLATAGRGWAVLAGGALFMASDLLIALGDLGGIYMERKDRWVWITYVPAQLLLITGAYTLM